ncbi:flavin reductase family protein [Massilia forsythiae]|uniref:Flavin reductase family protein n=1 Tax=Massilia forsythiae TaxID=2728020 RepID=A0A7Z2VZE2_9BURK|nr:flavin reductase family protein [Massilia forsythiae]QJE02222.1 flavin reductase family protein [Massilia forsythiae]
MLRCSSLHGSPCGVLAPCPCLPCIAISFPLPTEIGSYTRELVEASGSFVLAVPSRAMARLTLAVGSESGRETDKFAAHGIAWTPGEHTGGPLVEGCLGWLECRLIPEPHIQQAYDLFLGEVVGAWADPTVFTDGHWHMEESGKRSIHYVAGGHFFETGVPFEVTPGR